VCRGDGSWPQSHLFFWFFFYHAFIVSWYKKLRAALAMERTKPMNYSKQQKKPSLLVLRVLLKLLRPKPFARRSLKEGKYKKISTLKLLLIYRFFARRVIQRKNKRSSQPQSRKLKQKPPRGMMCFFTLGWGNRGGGSSGRGACRGENRFSCL